EDRALPQVTGVVHAAVRRRVDLDDVEVAGAGRSERDTRLAFATRIGRGPLLAVERPGEDPRAGGLAASAGPAEQVRVVDPAGPQRLPQRLGDVLLTLDLGKRPGPVLAVERKTHEGCPRPVAKAGDPPRTRQSLLILAAFRPWGGSQDDAARGVAAQSSHVRRCLGHSSLITFAPAVSAAPERPRPHPVSRFVTGSGRTLSRPRLPAAAPAARRPLPRPQTGR